MAEIEDLPDRMYAAIAAESRSEEPTFPAARQRSVILSGLGLFVLLMYLGSPAGGLIDLPVSFFAKNRLHLSAHALAQFRLITGIPLYLGFIFGFVRDKWSPFGLRDRGY